MRFDLASSPTIALEPTNRNNSPSFCLAMTTMRVVLEGEETVVELTDGERPFLERAIAGARIQALTWERSGLKGAVEQEDLRKQIVDLSTKHRVLSDFTALLVLETEYDYRRFQIDRNALSDIITVDPSGIGRGERTARSSDQGLARNRGILGMLQEESGHFLASPYGGSLAVGNDDEDVWGGLSGEDVRGAFGVGGLGLLGTGRGGGEVGSHFGEEGRMGTPRASGSGPG
jgi:hypothetical protein